MLGKVILCGGVLKLMLYKLFHWKQMSIGFKTIAYPSLNIQLSRNGRLEIGKKVSIRRNCELNVRNNALLHIGQNSFLNSNCLITAHKKIHIGDNVEFGPNVMIFDHDHKYNNGYEAKEFESDEIIIGNNVWIGAGTIILKGSKIGDNSVVGAGSIIKGEYDDEQLIYTKREILSRKIARNGEM